MDEGLCGDFSQTCPAKRTSCIGNHLGHCTGNRPLPCSLSGRSCGSPTLAGTGPVRNPGLSYSWEADQM